MGASEQVVLVDENGAYVGVEDKLTVHSTSTPLHLAFSVYLFNHHGDLLITRRALGKMTWPGVWTNSFCGHPQPGEDLADAVRRRADYELGASLSSLRLILPDFSYRAVDASGIVENELCPVFCATSDGRLQPRADEVLEWEWSNPQRVALAAENAPFAFSPWMRTQLPAFLSQLEPSGGGSRG